MYFFPLDYDVLFSCTEDFVMSLFDLNFAEYRLRSAFIKK